MNNYMIGSGGRANGKSSAFWLLTFFENALLGTGFVVFPGWIEFHKRAPGYDNALARRKELAA